MSTTKKLPAHLSSGDQGESLLADADALLASGDLLGARITYTSAEQAGADADRCAGGRWVVAMLDADYQAAWSESDKIRQRGAIDPHRFWNGEELRGGRVIVRCLHGYGDAVQMMQYALRLQSLAAHVIYEVPPSLFEIASCFHGVDHVITWGENAPMLAPEWNVQVECIELPYIFRTGLSDLPIRQRYLDLPKQLIEQVRRSMGRSARLRVGIVWAAGEWNQSRSIPLSSFAGLFANTSVEFWSLQGGKDAELERAKAPLLDVNSICGTGIAALAATIAQLDLIITVDTLVAHLAGALGKPVWILLQHVPDWRWMISRGDSPWYPSARIFRQKQSGDWATVIEEVSYELARVTHVERGSVDSSGT